MAAQCKRMIVNITIFDDQISLAKRIFLDNRALMPINAGFNALLPKIDQYMRHMKHILGWSLTDDSFSKDYKNFRWIVVLHLLD